MEERRSYEVIAADVRSAQNGDAKAMSRILGDVQNAVYYTCLKILRDETNAQDATQDVLFAIYRKIGTLKEPCTYVNWVNRMTANRCRDLLLKANHEVFLTPDEDGGDPFAVFEDMDEQYVPDKAIDNAETQRMILELVDALPDEQRMCVMLFYYDEMKTHEIANALDVSEGTIKSRLNYARKAIKEGVKQYEKQGIKLYGLSPIPFLGYFLGKAIKDTNTAAAATGIAANVSGTAAAGAVATAAGAASGGVFASALSKIALGVLSIGLIGGVGFGIFTLFDQKRIEPVFVDETERPAPVIEASETPTETPLSMPSDSPAPTLTPTPSAAPTARVTPRPQQTASQEPGRSPSSAPTDTPLSTPETTPATPEPTPAVTPGSTPEPAETPTEPPTDTPTPEPTEESTSEPIRTWSEWSESEPPADAEEIETQEQIRYRFTGTYTVETAASTWQEDGKDAFDAFRSMHGFADYTVDEPGTSAGNGLTAYTAHFYTAYTDWEKKEGAEPPVPFDGEQTLASETRTAYRYR